MRRAFFLESPPACNRRARRPCAQRSLRSLLSTRAELTATLELPATVAASGGVRTEYDESVDLSAATAAHSSCWEVPGLPRISDTARAEFSSRACSLFISRSAIE